MIRLLHNAADRTLPNRHQNTVGLGQLRVAQAIKRRVNVILKLAISCARLSHAFSEHSETRPTRVSRSRRLLAHSFSRMPAEDVLSRRELECDRHRSLGNFDRLF